MKRTPPSSRLARFTASLALAAALAACLTGSAQATFPGKPGPLVYPRFDVEESGITGGLSSHGPRKSQKPQQLTKAAGDHAPSFSADGRLIAFAGDHEGLTESGSHIYVMDADGSDLRQLTSGTANDSDPSFSPSGSEIAFDRTVGSGPAQIFTINLDGSGPRALTDGSGSDSDPVFTPNGRHIVYVSNRDADAPSDHSDIFVMGADGSGQRVLIDGIHDESEPDVSPDGRAIVFVSNRDHGPNIFIARANGTHVREVTHSHHDCFSSACYLAPSFSPDGKHIAFLREGRYSTALEVARPDGSGAREFDEGGTEEEGYGPELGAPTWGAVPR